MSDTTKFTPGYTPISGSRIHRSRLRVQPDGTATVYFNGQVEDITDGQQAFVLNAGSQINLYAEVAVDDTTMTEVKVAVVPTGKRVPQAPGGNGERAHRIGSVQGPTGASHVYLLSIDGSIDRAAHEAERAARRAEREQRKAAERAAAMVLLGYAPDADDDADDDSVDLSGF